MKQEPNHEALTAVLALEIAFDALDNLKTAGYKGWAKEMAVPTKRFCEKIKKHILPQSANICGVSSEDYQEFITAMENNCKLIAKKTIYELIETPCESSQGKPAEESHSNTDRTADPNEG